MSTLTRGNLEDWDTDPAPRLLNVALSRARGKFILVGDLDFVHDRGGRDSVVRHILSIIEQEGAVRRIDPRQLWANFRNGCPIVSSTVSASSSANAPATTPG